MAMKIKKNTKYFDLPFGSRIENDGSVSFKIWAPDANDVKLYLTDINKNFEMQEIDSGIYFLNTKEASDTSTYQYLINEEILVPDPYSRCQQSDVHQPSVVCNPKDFSWGNSEWKGLPWEQTSIYEMHIGAFTPEGTYKSAIAKLDYLKELGITAVELMPVADFPGHRGWGYDGVLLYAPDRAYGTPNELKELIDAAHSRGIQVFLDVVYNHFGPDGNYLYVYAKSQFFNEKQKTPWGDSIDFSNRHVRDFYVNNVLYWLEEYGFDGLRFDAVHAITDNSDVHILDEISQVVHEKYSGKRHVHLMLENEDNEAKFLDLKSAYSAQWNDDSHHALHVALTKENSGYYIDYNKKATNKSPAEFILKTFTEGFAYQGEPSPYRNGEKRGEPSKDLHPSHFINFIQNHDQIGNRAFGERIHTLTGIDEYKLAVAFYLLSPSIPMLYMGEEWATTSPFLYFCNFEEPLSSAVRDGRRKEFCKFKEFADPKIQNRIPDPTVVETFMRSKLNWNELNYKSHSDILSFYKLLLKTRNSEIIPLLRDINQSKTECRIINDYAFSASWYSGNKVIKVIFNLGKKSIQLANIDEKDIIYTNVDDFSKNIVPKYSIIWLVEEDNG